MGGNNPVDGYIREFQHRWTITIVLFLILFYYVYDIYQVVNKNHSETMTNNPWAARIPTVVDSGLTNTNVLTWGNYVGGAKCPTVEEANAYLATTGMDYYSDGNYEHKQSFLGTREAPVFYDIGDVRKTRDTRARNQSKVGIDAGGNYQQTSYIKNFNRIYNLRIYI